VDRSYLARDPNWSSGKDHTVDKLTIGHPRWPEFIGRLEQRLQFREAGDQPGNYQWWCGKGEDRFGYAREVLTEMGLQPAAALAMFRRRGAYCDCEILINLGDAGG
jgi:Protein of unknown function (DUF2695)